MNQPKEKNSVTKDTLETHLFYIRKELSEIREEMATMTEHFVTQKEFAPVKAVVYGLVGIILAGVIGAIITLVIR